MSNKSVCIGASPKSAVCTTLKRYSQANNKENTPLCYDRQSENSPDSNLKRSQIQQGRKQHSNVESSAEASINALRAQFDVLQKEDLVELADSRYAAIDAFRSLSTSLFIFPFKRPAGSQASVSLDLSIAGFAKPIAPANREVSANLARLKNSKSRKC